MADTDTHRIAVTIEMDVPVAMDEWAVAEWLRLKTLDDGLFKYLATNVEWTASEFASDEFIQSLMEKGK